MQRLIRALIAEAPPKVATVVKPAVVEAKLEFELTEGLFIATR
jgi:hypothetical protein